MVDRTEVDQMAKFMAAITPEAATAITTPATTTVAGAGTFVEAAAVADMKVILERFHAAADQVVMEAPDDRELREAMITESTEHGARIGSWEIRVNQTERHKSYDVVNATSQEPLAVDLLLYETAQGLVRILNAGGRINSHITIELLRAEQEYGSRVQDMIRYKHRLTHNVNSPRTMVFEARYSDAKRRAVEARRRVRLLSEGNHP